MPILSALTDLEGLPALSIEGLTLGMPTSASSTTQPLGAAPPTVAPPGLVALGELLVDISPSTPGASLDDDGMLQPLPGGAPANVAVAVARLGAASAFVGAVGNDPFGRRLRRVLADAGVDVSGVVTVEEPTAVAFVALTTGGEREFMFYGRPAAHDMLTTPDVDAFAAARPLGSGDVFHLSSNCLAREPARRASLHALDLAQRAGAAVSFDVNLRLALWDPPDKSEVLAVLLPVLKRSRLVKLSLDELEYLTGQRSLAATEVLAAELLAQSAELVTVTLGHEGVWYVTRGAAGHVKGFPVAAIDTTGAGDAFTAAVVTASLRDAATWRSKEATEGAMRHACAYAALSTTRPGAIPSFGDRYELAAFLASNLGPHGR